MNQFVLVGKIVTKGVIEKTEKDVDILEVKLAVSRPYKNEYGIYEKDYIKIQIIGNAASLTSENCNIGDVLGIKGCIRGNNDEMSLVSEKVTFLSTGANK